MKSLSILLTAIALLTFSGCYTQLMIEDDSPVSSNTQSTVSPAPVVIDPLLPGMTSEAVYVVTPTPVYVPVYNPEPITGYSNPAASAPAATALRNSGDQRSAAPAQPAAQNNSRNTGATRSGGR